MSAIAVSTQAKIVCRSLSFGPISLPLAAALAAFFILSGCARKEKAEAPPAPGPSASAESAHASIFPADVPNGLLSAKSCLPCHQAIYSEWELSRHRYASESLEDGLWSRAAGWTAEQVEGASNLYEFRSHLFSFDPAYRSDCDTCHRPSAAGWQGDYDEGVNCAVCHVVDGRLVGRNAIAAGKARHETVANPDLGSEKACAPCHQLEDPAPDVPFFTTVDEWRSTSYASDGYPCQTCHMPNKTGSPSGPAENKVYRAHTWPGGQDRQQLGYSCTMEISMFPAEFAPGEPLNARIRIKNDGAGHYLPTGETLHQIQFSANLTDPEGKSINFNVFQIGYRGAKPEAPIGDRRTAERGAVGARIKPEGFVTLNVNLAVPEDYPYDTVKLVAALDYFPLPTELAPLAEGAHIPGPIRFQTEETIVPRKPGF